MELYFLRHCDAAAVSGARYSDAGRQLTPAGKAKAAAIGMAIKKMGLEFDFIFSSPCARAWQTAVIVAQKTGMTKKVSEMPALAFGQPVKEAVNALRKISGDKSFLLVGHEPQFSEMISLLICGKTQGVLLEVKKGSLCKLSLDKARYGRAAVLDWLLEASQMKGMV